MRMFQASDDLGFLLEGMDVVSEQMRLQDFNGGLPTESDMLPQVDICEAPLSKPLNQVVVSKVFSDVMGHP